MSKNRIAVKGHVGKIEVINQGKDNEFVSGSLCVNEYMGKNDEGEPRYVDQWFDFVAFSGKSTLVQKANVAVGDYIEIAGPMRSRNRKDEAKDVNYVNWSVNLEDLEILKRKVEEA